MEIYLEKENKKININVKEKIKIKDILEKLKISVSSILIVKNKKIVLEDEFCSDEDEIELLSVVSGG